MDFVALAAELVNDPLSLNYILLSDAEAADVINTVDRAGTKSVPASDVRRYVLLNGLWPGLMSLASSSPNPLYQGTAITILQTLAPNSFDVIRMDDPEVAGAVSAMLQTMIDAGVMTETHRDAMVALGNTLVSRAQELGLGYVHHLDVAQARSL